MPGKSHFDAKTWHAYVMFCDPFHSLLVAFASIKELFRRRKQWDQSIHCKIPSVPHVLRLELTQEYESCGALPHLVSAFRLPR
jgi:hypothetical protein